MKKILNQASICGLIAVGMLIPSVVFATDIGDMPKKTGDTEQEKAFIEFIIPIINKVNAEMLSDQIFIDDYEKNKTIDKDVMRGLTGAYRLNKNASVADKVNELKNKIGNMPIGLLVAQAAYKSDFGRSIAAIEGNNLFDLYCNKPNCGPYKTKTPSGKDVEWMAYRDIESSIVHQEILFNRSKSLKQWRKARMTAVNEGTPFTLELSIPLIQGYLDPKSRKTYLEGLDKISKRYNLNKLDLQEESK